MDAPDSFGTAQWMFERRRHAEAAAALVDVLATSLNFAPAHALLSLCQCALKQNALAKHHAEKAVELAPQDPENYFILSQVLTRLFDWELVVAYARDGQKIIAKAAATSASVNALRAIEEAIRLSPDNADYRAHMACLKLMFARWTEVLEAANKGLEKDPQSIACLHYRAVAWLELDETAKSEEATKSLLALNPNSPHGHAGLGDLALYRRQAKEAEQHYLQALRLNPLLVWAEHGLDAARRMESGRAMVREFVAAQSDPMWNDPYRAVRWMHGLAKILVCFIAVLVLGQLVTAWLWPGHDLFNLMIKFLTRL